MPPSRPPTQSAQTPIMRDPIYQQLNERLRAMIRGGEARPGGKFPTEREVAERFGVSRVTANKALSSLVGEGVLEFRKGVGTFVRDLGMDYNLRALMSFTRKAEMSGKLPETDVRQFAALPAGECDADVREALGVADKETLFFTERLRLADGVPLILERRFIVGRHCPRLRQAQLAGSLYSLFTEHFGLHLSGADQTVRALNLSAGDARVLQVPAGSASIWVHAIGLCEHGPLWLEDTLYRGDLYAFQNSLGSDKAQRPARTMLAESGPPKIIGLRRSRA